MSLSYYILAPTISLKKCQFSCYYLFTYQLQQLALKNVHFHVTMDQIFPLISPSFPQSLYIPAPTISIKSVHFNVIMDLVFPFTSPPFPQSLYTLAPTINVRNVYFDVNIDLAFPSTSTPFPQSLYLLTPTISIKCPFSYYYGLGISLHLATFSTISLYTRSNNIYPFTGG